MRRINENEAGVRGGIKSLFRSIEAFSRRFFVSCLIFVPRMFFSSSFILGKRWRLGKDREIGDFMQVWNGGEAIERYVWHILIESVTSNLSHLNVNDIPAFARQRMSCSFSYDLNRETNTRCAERINFRIMNGTKGERKTRFISSHFSP